MYKKVGKKEYAENPPRQAKSKPITKNRLLDLDNLEGGLEQHGVR